MSPLPDPPEQDANTGNWWLQVEDDAIGYWPNSLVSGIADGAEMVQYGGEIFDVATEVGTAVAHTTTEMGSEYIAYPDLLHTILVCPFAILTREVFLIRTWEESTVTEKCKVGGCFSEELVFCKEIATEEERPSVDGDIIDCVGIYKQPAFDHPLLYNHTIQMRPSAYPKGVKAETMTKIDQPWHLNGRCPEGTIPIHRTQKSDLMRATSLKNFGKKYPEGIRHPQIVDDGRTGHVHAIVSTKEDKYFGGKADLHLWNPRVYADEFSLAQIWITTKDRKHTLEDGWMVYPDLYGDNQTRSFIYWTSDAYRTTGCYNLKCSGFVQVGSEYLLGGVISPVSVYGGHLFFLAVNIFQDVQNGNWWLQLQNDLVGYWPGSLVPRFAGGAEIVQYGGEIVDSGVAHGIKGPHTTTEMGSGHFSGEGEGKAGAFTRLQVMDKDISGYKSPQDVTSFVREPHCYDLSLMKTTGNWGVYFFYGGPGRNQNCP
ncbi:hypothetical protein QJS04_geneDACA010453 [Acorus gramineus]|uniref:Neprosin PEP catalytic domain-containing protein n=1 Tax=Acorus gramineus TaxID=55184 RepID=A0AAV9ALY6_ACOGR|nr:hypothetical protein QJS04_geneDACA010453 [Acorus gramineus]